jgi:hypothetical protein
MSGQNRMPVVQRRATPQTGLRLASRTLLSAGPATQAARDLLDQPISSNNLSDPTGTNRLNWT